MCVVYLDSSYNHFNSKYFMWVRSEILYPSVIVKWLVCNISPCLQLKDLQDKYSECEDMLHEAREDIKNLRNKSLPNSTVQRYTALSSVLPMDSLAAEIEGTFRKGLDNPAPSDYKSVSYLLP